MIDNKIKNRIKELIDILNNASDAYYNQDKEIMSNFEYDKLYDELVELEDKYDIHYSNSPTSKVGSEVSTNLPKVTHEIPMLSLNKTKDKNTLRDWLSDNIGVLSYKLDGLTIVLTYDDGELKMAVTRGNGEIGELITNNAKNFVNIPLKIKHKSHLIIRGEAIIKYSDFNNINDDIIDEEQKYKNPRNLCSGSVRQLDPKITKDRHVYFYAFSIVTNLKNEILDDLDTYSKQLDYLSNLGFDTVYHKIVDKNNIIDTVEWFAKDVLNNDNPSDGLVLMFDDIKYGLSLGRTSKFPRNAIAFKWQDETAKTTLLEIEWSPSRTGLINPVAIFEPVELEGTTVKRASLHNLSIMDELEIGIGDTISVYKANMIIPQIAENFTKSNNYEIPKKCPVCKKELKVHNENGVKTLHCENVDCPVKHIKNFENFVSRNCMNIDGISISTVEKFISLGFIKEYADLYRLAKYKKQIIELDGFGEKSYENIIKSIDDKRNVELYRVINSFGISGIGTANAKILAKYYDGNFDKIRNAKVDELCNIDSIGPVLAESIYEFFHNKNNIKIIDDLLTEIKIVSDKNTGSDKLNGLIFVITGALNNFSNRDELIKIIEDNGGKSAASVSNKTSYLINNDTTSNSSKNKKAKELGVKIISENDFMEMIK